MHTVDTQAQLETQLRFVAQALGDFEALSKRHRRVVRIDLGRDVEKGLRRVLSLVKEAVSQSNAAVAGVQK